LKEFYKENKDIFIIFGIALFYYVQHLFGFRFGINFEESRDANAYILSLDGLIPYRDFEWLYGPFSFFVYPFIMKLFGISLIVLRLSYIVFASLTIPLVYFLSKRIMPCAWAGVASFLSIIFFNTPYYTFNHVFIVPAALASLLFICRFIETKKSVNLFLSGIFVSIALLTKPLLTGISLTAAISLYLLFLKELGTQRSRIKNFLIFIFGLACLVFIYLVYFYLETALKNISVAYPFLARNSLIVIEQITNIHFKEYGFKALLFERFHDVLSIAKIIVNVPNVENMKQIIVNFFDGFIFFLPFILSVLFAFIYAFRNRNILSPQAKAKIRLDGKFLLLFVIFAVFISLESLRVFHRYNRAYTIQVSFILLVYVLYFLKSFYFRKHIVLIISITLILFCGSFLHFLRYPYSMFKKYSQPLVLERAKGVLLTLEEKRLYESLSAYLSGSFKEDDKMAVVGYTGCYSQFSFLAKKRNVFQDDEFIFVKLNDLVELNGRDKNSAVLLPSLENKIISRLVKEKTKIILIVVDDPILGLKDYKFLSGKVKTFFENNYYLCKTFGPADIQGLGGRIGYVKLYKLKGEAI